MEHHEMQQSDKQRFTEDPGAMMLEHPSMYSWVQPIIMILAVWLITSPTVFSYTSQALIYSDIISGVVAFAIASYTLMFPKRAWLTYANAAVGVWLILAPLAFWAPNAAAYMNDTLIGTLLITFAFVVPMSMPMPGPDVPPGWSYNPSTWQQRAPIIVFGLIGFFLSRPMAAYQLGYIDSLWEPFFNPGTQAVLNSDVSKAFPISDAGLGAAVYLIETLSTFMGDQRRWRTMPWMVAIFGLAVVPLGIVSIVLMAMQPMVVGAWCTLCLLAAAAMLLMIPLALDEVVAMIQFLNHSRKQGKSVWHVFWHGGNLPDATDEPRKDRENAWEVKPMLWGVSYPLGLITSTAFGILFLFLPYIFTISGAAADSFYLSGTLVLTFTAIAFAEVGRSARLLNMPVGLWLAISPFFFDLPTSSADIIALVSGLLLVIASIPLGPIYDEYGTFNAWARWQPIRKSQGQTRRRHGRLAIE